MAKASGNDLTYLAKRCDEIATGIRIAVDKTVSEAAIVGVAELARATPVDVGTARSNWIVSLDQAAIGIRRAFSPFPSRWRGGGSGGSRGETRNQAGVVWSAQGVLSRRKTDQTIYITNNLPYIERLNEGHSPQSASGIVQRSIATTVQRLSQIAVTNLKRELE